ncbi:helix-turn-helix domain-containing protein, partial [Latilactobacillus sakei]
LLRKSSLSITDISYECGFTSSSYFSKFFQSNMGMKPIQYRNRFVIKG